jgi:nitrate reductase molybdenum cofactor assembly chaperone NarJ/NarW
MTEDDRKVCKVLSVLLDYPSDELLDGVKGIRAIEIADWKGIQVVRKFVDYLVDTPLIRLQETYTATFDLNPATTLNLTYHRWGDGRERGSALVRLSTLYAQAGYEIGDGELPDYLPLVLEFLSVGPPEAAGEIMAEYRLHVGAIASRLAEAGSPYADIVQHAAHLCCITSDYPHGRATP